MKSLQLWLLVCSLLPSLMQAAVPLKKTGLVTRTSLEYHDDVQRIKNLPLALLTEPNRDGFRPLHRAAYHCKPKAIDALVQAGVDVNSRTSPGRICWIDQSALKRAIVTHVHFVAPVQSTFSATVSTLIGHGANLNEEMQLSMIESDEYQLGSILTMREYLQYVPHHTYNLKQYLVAGLHKRKQTHTAVVNALPATMPTELKSMICNYVVLFEKEDEAVLAGELS